MGRGVTDERAPRRSWVDRLPLAVAVLQGLVVLGPVLAPGVAIRYDMAWSPDPRWTPFVLGLDTPAPRAVPSDAAAVLVGHVVGAGLAQKVILLGILVALGVGAAYLVAELDPLAGPMARTVATVASVWNPFVYERLMVGQWTVLAGLALLPWGLRQVFRIARGVDSTPTLAMVVVIAGLGGANTLAVMLAAVVPALLVVTLIRRDRGSLLALVATGSVGLGMAAAWALPAMLADVRSDPSGGAVFVPVADSPLGVIGSLASGGGFWNSAVHPEARQVILVSGTAAVLTLIGVIAAVSSTRTCARWGLVAAVGAPTLIVLLSVVAPLERSWAVILSNVPGAGLLRDAHKFIAPWVLVAAVGLGLGAALLQHRLRTWGRGPGTALLVGLPIALTSYLAWGGLGRLEAVQVPTTYRAALTALNQAPPGDVGLLPWSQYRRYDWNANRISLTLVPRMVNHVVLFDDSLPLRSGVVAGESSRAAGVTTRIEQGQPPARALAAAGVRYVLLERTAAGEELEAEVRAIAPLLIDTQDVLVADLGAQEHDDATVTTPATAPVTTVGWLVTIATLAAVVVTFLTRRARARND